jgi:hypothetical protein
MPDAKQASQRVLNDRLDVLIDMDGYSNEGLRRSELFALRHAPVTVRGSRRRSAKQRNFSNGAKALAARRLLQRLKNSSPPLGRPHTFTRAQQFRARLFDWGCAFESMGGSCVALGRLVCLRLYARQL